MFKASDKPKAEALATGINLEVENHGTKNSKYPHRLNL